MLSGSVTPGEDTWVIDSGASKHMTGQKKTLSNLEKKHSPQKVSLGDDYQYPIKGIGEESYKLGSRNPLKIKEVLYVAGLKKNLLSISALDKKGFRVAFINGQVLMWPKGKNIEDEIIIGEEEGGLYKCKDIQKQPLFMRPLAQVNYSIGGFLTSTTKHYPM